MHILFITFSDINVCGSSNIRNISMIKGLLDLGHDVDIISYRSSNNAVLVDESFKNIISECDVFEITASLSTEKVSSGLLDSKNTSFKRKVYNKLRRIYYSLEPVDSLRNIAKTVDISTLHLGKYDLMISSSNPYSVHIFADRIRNMFFDGKLKWIQYWGDALYLDTLTRSPIFPFRVKNAERKLISSCDKVVYTNDVVLKLQKELFPECSDKMSFVETPYGFDVGDDSPIEYSVGYFGSFSSSVRNIIPLYSTLKNLSCKSIIIGNGDQIIESTDKVSVLPRASVNEVMKYENRTRILVCVCNKLSSKGETGLIPGKVYHYGATTKEVLVVGATPDVKRFLSGYERYYFADNDEDSIRTALLEILGNAPKCCEPIEGTMPIKAAAKFVS